MNPAIKRRWVAALRSGKYRQITGQLAGTDNYRCCLGVLGDVAGIPYDPSRGVLCGEAVTGLSVKHEEVLAALNDGGWGHIADMADINEPLGTRLRSKRRRTFTEIADIIEKHL